MLSVKNFDKFQHYKDRSPVWIKLYRSLLRDYEFAQLPDSARGQLLMIWLLASEMGNQLPNDAEWIKRQINATEPVNLSVLISAGFLVDCDSKSDSNHVASRFASDMLLAQRREREERETEKEGEGEVASRAKPRSPRTPQECGEDVLVELQNSPAYAHLDVRLCYFKMVEWCKRNRKVPSERRFINWLNHEDKPMTAKSKPPTKANVGSPAPLEPVPLALVNGFMEEHIDGLIAANDLIQLGNEYDDIVARGGAKAAWEIRCVTWYELHKNEPATPEQMAELNASINALAKR
jgi:hypothetical protein